MDVRPQNVLSICSGGGGLDLAFKLAVPTARTVCMVEREAFAVAHLVDKMQAGQLDECPVWSDATTFKGRPWRGIVDWVIAGIPCQPHSQAGRRQGSHDKRDLWSITRRIIVQCRPSGVVIENVEGMLSAGADQIPGAFRIINDLGALGFVCEIGLFSAAEVGFTHRRNRVCILAYRRSGGVADASRSSRAIHPRSRGEGIGAADSGGRGQALGNASRGRRDWRSQGEVGRAQYGDAAERAGGSNLPISPPGPGDVDAWRQVLAISPEIEPAISKSQLCGMADGLASRVDRLRMCGNGVHPLALAHGIQTCLHALAEQGVSTEEFFMMEHAA